MKSIIFRAVFIIDYLGNIAERTSYCNALEKFYFSETDYYYIINNYHINSSVSLVRITELQKEEIIVQKRNV